MKILGEAATREALPFDVLIARLREMFRTGCEVPARHVHAVRTKAGSGTVLMMPAWTERYLGIKTVNIYPDNARQGLPGLFSTYVLFDATTGRPLAQVDGDVITARRTAAASALAASYLARKNATRLAVLGTGRVGSLLAHAYSSVMTLERVDVWDRTPDKAQRLAANLASQGVPAVLALERESAVREADVVSTATLATSPIVTGAWLGAGSHLDLIGGFSPEMREADDDAFRGADVFVDTQEAIQKSGEILGAIASGVLERSAVKGSLADLCRQVVEGRSSDSQRTVFKSVGTALEDLAAAVQVYEYWNCRDTAELSEDRRTPG
jgi:ornithine cyclodeaminase